MSDGETIPTMLLDAWNTTGSEPNSVYRKIRNDILDGSLAANERLKVGTLAERYGTSTNPVREALQQLRGEGFVVISPNRGARVREIDENFIRDTSEIEVLIEPYLTRWFVGLVTDSDIVRLEAIQDEIEAFNFADLKHYTVLDTQFHGLMYERHYNSRALEMWWRHREILNAISRDFEIPLKRQSEAVHEHRQIIAHLKAQDAAGAAHVVAQHVTGAGRNLVEQLRLSRGGRRARSTAAA